MRHPISNQGWKASKSEHVLFPEMSQPQIATCPRLPATPIDCFNLLGRPWFPLALWPLFPFFRTKAGLNQRISVFVSEQPDKNRVMQMWTAKQTFKHTIDTTSGNCPYKHHTDPSFKSQICLCTAMFCGPLVLVLCSGLPKGDHRALQASRRLFEMGTNSSLHGTGA